MILELLSVSHLSSFFYSGVMKRKKFGARKVLAQAVTMAWWEILIDLFSIKQEVVES